MDGDGWTNRMTSEFIAAHLQRVHKNAITVTASKINKSER